MRRSLRSAWAISALVHALLVLALLWLRPSRRSGGEVVPPPPPIIELELAEEPRARTAAPAPERPGELVRSPRQRAAEPRVGVPAPPSDSKGAPESRGEAAPARPHPDRPSGESLDLSLGALSAGARARVVGPPPEATLEARPSRPSVDELRVQVERAEDAVANVRGGRVDPLLYDYLRGARKRFEDDARQLADRIAMGPGDTVRSWGRGYLDRVDQVHRERAGVDDNGPGLSDAAAARQPHSDVLAGYGETTRMVAAGAEQRRVEVCLDVAPGRETTATVRGGSGNVALDRVALEAFQKSAAVRPVPADARAGRACYEVRISAFRAPPLPFISCGFDELKGVSCIWPFKKVTSVTGRLLSVEYPPGSASPSSLLRKAR